MKWNFFPHFFSSLCHPSANGAKISFLCKFLLSSISLFSRHSAGNPSSFVSSQPASAINLIHRRDFFNERNGFRHHDELFIIIGPTLARWCRTLAAWLNRDDKLLRVEPRVEFNKPREMSMRFSSRSQPFVFRRCNYKLSNVTIAQRDRITTNLRREMNIPRDCCVLSGVFVVEDGGKTLCSCECHHRRDREM